MREEGVALEDIPQSAPLGRHVDPGIAVEEDLAADDDAPAVRPDEPGEALKGQGLAGPGGAKERHDLLVRLPVDLEGERGQALDHLHLEIAGRRTRAHCARAPSRPAATSTRQDSAVRRPTRTSAWSLSPVCTAV